jgi:predicted AlkP superfamily pyrophosphatase or phosphodiesterase
VPEIKFIFQLQKKKNMRLPDDQKVNDEYEELIVDDQKNNRFVWCGKRRNLIFLLSGLILVVVIVVLVVVLSEKNSEGIGRISSPTVLLVSMDGFRHDYFDLVDTPHFNRLKSSGLYVRKTISVFPSKTFPNHYSMATGLIPDSTGIFGDRFYDPERQKIFNIAHSDGWWNGEPIWITSELQGISSAAYFWPGSDALIKSKKPKHVQKFNISIGWKERTEQILRWLSMPDNSDKPRIILMYWEEPDFSGHAFGASSEPVKDKVKLLDEIVGNMVEKAKSIPGSSEFLDIILTTDHGMTNISKPDYLYLENYIDLSLENVSYEIITYSPLLQIWSKDYGILGSSSILDELYANLSKVPQLSCWLRKQNIPQKYHLVNSNRIAPLLCEVQFGLELRTRSIWTFHTGEHGFDSDESDMAGFLLGNGPSFTSGKILESMPNIDLYNIICNILNIKPAQNNGTTDLARYVKLRNL